MNKIIIDPKSIFDKYHQYCMVKGIAFTNTVTEDFKNFLKEKYGNVVNVSFNKEKVYYEIEYEMSGAVMIENRQDHGPIIERHREFLPKYFGLNTLNLASIKSPEAYNRLLTSKQFWLSQPYDKILIFQHDSGLLREGIEEFLEYDFIGAPLYHIDFPAMNGGLSLRSKEAMIKCIDHRPWNPNLGNEDIYFCNILKEIGGNLPTKEVAQKFSVETIFGLGSLGYHAIDKWHSEEKVNQILNQYK